MRNSPYFGLTPLPSHRSHMQTTEQITGGYFDGNEADEGGFLYKEGRGDVSCVGATVLRSKGVNGGAIYAVNDAVLDWRCNISENTALAGPAM